MKQRALIISAILILVSIILHGYLSFHYYELHFSPNATQSACNISDVFNCDAVALSSYASVLGVPLATLGMGFHIIMLLMVITLMMGFSSKPERMESLLINCSGLAVLASVAMGLISITQMSVYCPNCMILYLTSLITLFVLLFGQEDRNPIIHIKYTLQNIDKTVIIWMVVIILFPLLSHTILLQKHGGNKTQQYAENGYQVWKLANKETLTPLHAISSGPQENKLHIVEIADFLCPHCKQASQTVKLFLDANKDVRFTFSTFPLDGTCNPKIDRKGFGVTCRLSASIICAEDQKLAWHLHDFIFENQQEFASMTQTNSVDLKLQSEVEKFSHDFPKFQSCMDAEATYKKIAENSETAHLAGLQGTPTFFVNGKKISNMLLIPVLSKIYQDLN